MSEATQAAGPAITFRSISKFYGEIQVLHDVNAVIPRGATVAVLGSSGSGKSTLVRCINRLEIFQAGEITVGDTSLTPQGLARGTQKLSDRQVARFRTGIGMVFQSFNLFQHVNVLKNLTEAPVGVLGWSREQAIDRARDLLAKVGLPDKEEAYPSRLSGGQQQRIAIARALMMEPSIMLFDEPTSALDPELEGEVLRVIKLLADEGSTMILVTHDMKFAREVSDRVVFLHQGLIEETGTVDEVFGNTKSARLKQFLSAAGHG